MVGPFPGMDPYLEDPVLWPGVHQGLITGVRNVLNRLLPSGYVADIGERIYVVQRMEVREIFVEIVPVGDETRVVTVIEVLSYINKARGSEGQNRYLTKQKELLASSVHFIEIDLLRSGEHTMGFPRESLIRFKRWDYLVSLHRHERRAHCETWPRTLRERLPRIWVPLDNGMPDVMLDLQEVFDHNYDDGAYARRIDYSRDPSIPLAREDSDWADSLLRDANLRT